MLSSPYFRLAFVFSISSLMSHFPLTSLHLAEAALSPFLCLYTLCAVLRKYHEMSYNYSHFSY